MLSLLSIFPDKFIEIDQWLFLKINTEWTHSFLDSFLVYTRYPTYWVPLYVFLLIFVFKNFGWKSWSWLLFVLVTFAITDQLSSTVIKKTVERLRPCSDPDFFWQIRLMLKHCAGGYSFTSSHATNHFGVGVFFFLTLKKYIGYWAWLFVVWAGMISYAQVYVGVHYPLDISCGAILGTSVAFFTHFLYKKYFGGLTPSLQSKS